MTESPLEPELQESIQTFKAAHPGGIWTPRKVQGSPRREIWGLAGSRKCLPVASKQEPIRAQPYEPPPPPAPMKKAMELRPAYIEEEELHRRAEQLLAEAQQLENARPTPSLQVKLGTILLSKDDYIKKVLKDWDKGKGEFLKGEFRLDLRGIGLVVTSSEADDLFDSWDDDKGGSLDMKELKRALQQTQQAAKAFHNTPDTSTDKANTRYALAKLAQEAAEATAEAVELEKAHRRHVNGLASRADIQLGALLYKRQIKPAVMYVRELRLCSPPSLLILCTHAFLANAPAPHFDRSVFVDLWKVLQHGPAPGGLTQGSCPNSNSRTSASLWAYRLALQFLM